MIPRGLTQDAPLENPKAIAKGDFIVQLMVNERYDKFALLKSGRTFKARARGQSGAYDRWQEVDLLAEIKTDLKI